MTVDEFLKLPDIEEQRVELFQGEVVAMASGGPVHEIVKSNLVGILRDWLKEHPIGTLFVETGYRIDDHNSLIPDLSVLSNDRFERSVEELLRDAPDLAIEVVSSETADRLLAKIQMYLKHGSKAVWAVFPERRTVQTYTAARQTMLGQDKILEDHDALPGFSTLVSAIFKRL